MKRHSFWISGTILRDLVLAAVYVMAAMELRVTAARSP